MIDTHAHLQECADPPADLLERARAAGVDRVIEVAAWAEAWAPALELADHDDGVFVVFGVHPHRAADTADLDALRRMLEHERAVGVGETGLDFYRDYAPRDRQHALFAAELELAQEVGKTVVVHTRGADDETARALEGFNGRVVMHCFSTPALLPVALERSYYVSFAGNVTYPNAGELREAAVQVPDDRILAETDAPYLAPQPRRGRSNEPANVVHTLGVLAQVRGVEPDALERQIEANAAEAFGLP